MITVVTMIRTDDDGYSCDQDCYSYTYEWECFDVISHLSGANCGCRLRCYSCLQ